MQLRHTVQHVDALARGGVYHRADPQSEPPPGLLARVEQAVGRFREAKRGRLNPFVLTISPQDTFEQWKSSTGHCENMMNGNLKTIGIGYAKGGPYGHYWTQSFDN